MNKKVNIVGILLIVFLAASLLLVGCQKKENSEPEGAKAQRLVVLTPPILSILWSMDRSEDLVVVTSPWSFVNSNQDLLDLVYPKWKTIETKFTNQDFDVNNETLLKLNPTTVICYGEASKKPLQNLGVSIVDTHFNDYDAKSLTLRWEKQMQELLGKEGKSALETEWAYTDDKLRKSSSQVKEKVSGLFISTNMRGKISVCGSGGYGDGYFQKAGIENVAKEINREKEVTMEEILKWDPDVVYIFMGAKEKDYYNNSIPGQDWSQLRAFKEGNIKAIPYGVFAWGAPCADSPIATLWYFQSAYPDIYSKHDFKQDFKRFYSNVYQVDLSDELMDKVLAPRIGEK